MRLSTLGMAVFLIGMPGISFAQASPAGRAVIAAAKLPTVTDSPVYFKVVSVTVPAGAKSSISGASRMLYQITGTTQANISDVRTIKSGEGTYIESGRSVDVTSTDGPSTFLLFALVPANQLNSKMVAAPATEKELYRTPAAIPDLKAGAYDVNLTRVTFPAQMPSNAPHHRSGAAVYYVISGTGANTIAGQTITRKPGAFIYEPYSLVHQWGNPGSEPLTFVTFNINPEGVPAVQQGEPAK